MVAHRFSRAVSVAAITPTYPITSTPIIRGDPITVPVTIKADGEPVDISSWVWRAQIRRSYDGALIDEFSIRINTPEGTDVPCQLLLSLDTFQTTKLKTGYVFDLEQLIDNATPQTWQTWWIVQRIVVQKDVSHN
jgi:hypothetical protein